MSAIPPLKHSASMVILREKTRPPEEAQQQERITDSRAIETIEVCSFFPSMYFPFPTHFAFFLVYFPFLLGISHYFGVFFGRCSQKRGEEGCEGGR